MQDDKPAQQQLSRAVRLKQKLKSLLSKTSEAKKTLLDAGAVALCVLSLGLLVARVPEMHDNYIRHKVGSRVYMIKGKLDGGGGTGFQLKAPSGQNYIVTNSHVCEHVKDLREDKQSALVVDDDGNYVPRRIIAISDQSDLCLLEGMPGVDGLSLGHEPGKGERMTVVGHPHLRPLTLSSGDVIGAEDIKILDYVLPTGNPLIDLFLPIKADGGKCDLPKNELKTFPIPPEMGGGEIKACFVVTEGAYMTSITIFPGNSGSPMVDFWGRVTGVAFAASESDNYGEVVSLDDLKTFMAKY